MTDLKLSYHYGNEGEQYSFYRIPKILFTDDRYKGLSFEAKMLYGFMLDRMALSVKNGWFDDNNRVYIYYTLENACADMGQGHSKMVRVMAELDDKKGYGLIERKKQGQGKPTIIYVKNCCSLPLQAETKTKTEPKKYPKPTFGNDKTSKNEKSEDDSNENYTDTQQSPADNLDFSVDKPALNLEYKDVFPSFLIDEEVQTSEIDNSRFPQKRSQDFLKRTTNNTKLNNTDFNDTQSIYPSISPFEKQELETDGLMDRISKAELEEIVLDELYEQKTLPYEYVADERKMEIAIHTFTEYETMEQSVREYGGTDFNFAAFKLFNEALIEMLTTKQPMTLKGAHVTYAKVYDKLIPYISFDTVYGNIYSLQETAISDFTTACKEQTIKNHLAYMKSCIWNAMQVGDIGIQALIKKDFG